MLPEKNDNRIDIEQKHPDENKYYLKAASKYRTAKYIVLCLTILFFVVMVSLFRNEITLENLRYLFKDLEVGESMTDEVGDDILFDSNNQVNVKLYKGDICIAGGSNFYLCDVQGNQRINQNSKLSNPCLETSKKYLLLYGLSENSYSIYNTFTLLHSESFSYPITGAAVSNNGTYAIVSRTSDYRSAIYIYDNNFKRIGVIYKDKYVMNIEFNKNSSELLIVSAYSSNGEFCTEVSTYVPNTDTENCAETVTDVIPLKCSYNSDGGYTVLCDSKLLFYDSELILRNTYDFGNKTPKCAELSEKYAAVTFSEYISGDSVKTLIFDNSGTVIYNNSIMGSSKNICISDNYVFILNDNNICRISPAEETEEYADVAINAMNIVPYSDDMVLACYSDRISKVNFNESGE